MTEAQELKEFRKTQKTIAHKIANDIPLTDEELWDKSESDYFEQMWKSGNFAAIL